MKEFRVHVKRVNGAWKQWWQNHSRPIRWLQNGKSG